MNLEETPMPRNLRVADSTDTTATDAAGKRVLVRCHESFAALGLSELLRQAGHEVDCVTVNGQGAGQELDSAASGSYDTLVSYGRNAREAFGPDRATLDWLADSCRRGGIKHVIYVLIDPGRAASSLCGDDSHHGDAVSAPHGDPAVERLSLPERIIARLPEGTRLSLARPGFVLAPGLSNPIAGIGVRLPWNRLLVIGGPTTRVPLITRDRLNEAVVQLVTNPPAADHEILVLADGDSPTRREFLWACCSLLGSSAGVSSLPGPLSGLLSELGEELLHPVPRLSRRPRSPQRSFSLYDAPSAVNAEQRLNMRLRDSWQTALRRSRDGQEPNFSLHQPAGPVRPIARKQITFLGFGWVVKNRYVPALRHLGFRGDLTAYDVADRRDPTGQRILSIRDARLAQADLCVVASPSPVHTEALPLLAPVDMAILVEKPLCQTADELRRWLDFAGARRSTVSVCHNFRFKRNVQRMMRFLRSFNPGKLLGVSVQAQELPVRVPHWASDETKTRAFLLDHAIHFLDLACMFGRGEWRVAFARGERDQAGRTSLIEGRIESENYPVNFLLRRGFMPRRNLITFNFQNYLIDLGFGPDTFRPIMADDNPFVQINASIELMLVTSRKLFDVVSGRLNDTSHARIISGILNRPDDSIAALEVATLVPFYRMLFRLADAAYDG